MSTCEPWIARAHASFLTLFPPCCAGFRVPALLQVSLSPIPRDHDADGLPLLHGPGEQLVRVGSKLFAPDCSSACRHAPPEAPYPHRKPNSAFWTLPSVMHNCARLHYGLSGGALRTAFRTLCGSNQSMPACMCAHLDMIEQIRFCLGCWDLMTRAHDRPADGRL